MSIDEVNLALYSPTRVFSTSMPSSISVSGCPIQIYSKINSAANIWFDGKVVLFGQSVLWGQWRSVGPIQFQRYWMKFK